VFFYVVEVAYGVGYFIEEGNAGGQGDGLICHIVTGNCLEMATDIRSVGGKVWDNGRGCIGGIVRGEGFHKTVELGDFLLEPVTDSVLAEARGSGIALQDVNAGVGDVLVDTVGCIDAGVSSTGGVI
jgi:hypothetical protein